MVKISQNTTILFLVVAACMTLASCKKPGQGHHAKPKAINETKTTTAAPADYEVGDVTDVPIDETTTLEPTQPPTSDDCKQPKVVGKCRAYIRRFYFDAKTGECNEFVYGGCGANGNNFHEQQACEEKCLQRGYNVETTSSKSNVTTTPPGPPEESLKK